MTEKDAVKCAAFAGDDHWYLPGGGGPGRRLRASHLLPQP